MLTLRAAKDSQLDSSPRLYWWRHRGHPVWVLSWLSSTAGCCSIVFHNCIFQFPDPFLCQISLSKEMWEVTWPTSACCLLFGQATTSGTTYTPCNWTSGCTFQPLQDPQESDGPQDSSREHPACMSAVPHVTGVTRPLVSISSNRPPDITSVHLESTFVRYTPHYSNIPRI